MSGGQLGFADARAFEGDEEGWRWSGHGRTLPAYYVSLRPDTPCLQERGVPKRLALRISKFFHYVALKEVGFIYIS